MSRSSKVELRRAVALVAVGTCIVAAGCIKTSNSDGNDGSTCAKSTDCKSKSCTDGTCDGRTCDGQDAGECDPGWICTGGSSGGLFSDPQPPSCTPTCGVCPSTTHCPAFATSANGTHIADDGGIVCARGPQRAATIDGPDTVVAGSTATYTVTFAPAQKFEAYEWYYGAGDSTSLEDVTSSAGSHDNVLVFQPTGSPSGDIDAILGVTATDVNVSYDSKLMTGEGSRKIHVTCTPPGGDCSAYGSCCGGGTSCDYGATPATCK